MAARCARRGLECTPRDRLCTRDMTAYKRRRLKVPVATPVGVFGPVLQSATSRFKFVECTAIHARRFKACKCCRSAKVVLPKLTEASNQTSNYLLGRSNAIKLSDSRRAVSSLQLVCAGLTRGFECRTVRGEGPCVQRRAWRQTDTGRCR